MLLAAAGGVKENLFISFIPACVVFILAKTFSVRVAGARVAKKNYGEILSGFNEIFLSVSRVSTSFPANTNLCHYHHHFTRCVFH